MISLDNEMAVVFRTGLLYQPTGMEPETGDLLPTCRNVAQLLKTQVIAAVIAREGRVLLVFDSGMSFYASGFSFEGEGAIALARALVHHPEGRWSSDFATIHEDLVRWEGDGPVPLTI